MPVNITNITAIDSFHDLGRYAAGASNGLFWGIILIALFVIAITRLRHQGPEEAVAGASLACFILGTIFVNLNYVSFMYPIAFLIILAGALLVKKFKPQ
jgi:hypothetical protein